jgi:LmbE family N-acetylglucosaminyl deacetylase
VHAVARTTWRAPAWECQPERLAFDDDEGAAREPAAVAAALAPVLRDAEVVLAPGSPLQHPDHRLVATATAACVPPTAVLAHYLEQPYATWQALSRPGSRSRGTAAPLGPEAAQADVTSRWRRSPACWRCQRRKLLAAGHYRSQLAVLRRWPRARIAVHELLSGGERIAWPPDPTDDDDGSSGPVS